MVGFVFVRVKDPSNTASIFPLFPSVNAKAFFRQQLSFPRAEKKQPNQNLTLKIRFPLLLFLFQSLF
jgi:hypothetical protein